MIGRLEKLRLNPLRRLSNRTRDEHQSGKGGTSTEFADYRDYVAGDDVKNVDWNIFARNRTPVRQALPSRRRPACHDPARRVELDAVRRNSTGRQLAIAFGLMGLMGGEQVSVYTCQHDSRRAVLPRASGRVSRKLLFDFIERAGGAITRSRERLTPCCRGIAGGALWCSCPTF